VNAHIYAIVIAATFVASEARANAINCASPEADAMLALIDEAGSCATAKDCVRVFASCKHHLANKRLVEALRKKVTRDIVRCKHTSKTPPRFMHCPKSRYYYSSPRSFSRGSVEVQCRSKKCYYGPSLRNAPPRDPGD